MTKGLTLPSEVGKGRERLRGNIGKQREPTSDHLDLHLMTLTYIVQVKLRMSAGCDRDWRVDV